MDARQLLLGVLLAGSFGLLPSAAVAGPSSVFVGDDRLQVRLDYGAGRLIEAEYLVNGKRMEGLLADAWSVQIDGSAITAAGDIRCADEVDEGVLHQVSFSAQDQTVHWTLDYRRSGPGRVTKTLALTPKRDLRLDGVMLWKATESTPPVVARTKLQDIAAFYRQNDRSLLVSLDFPCSRIESVGGATTVSYPPFLSLRKGETYTAHSLTLGAASLTGSLRYGFDVGEVRAMDAYVQERFTPRFERPMVVGCSINNRYTQPRGGVIFYTMKDHPTLRDHTDLLERELALMSKLGVEYYQVFPGVFDWGPDDPSAQEVDRLMDVARRYGVRMGDYSGTSSLFCPHYNEYGNSLDRPEWLIRDEHDKPAGGYCFGCPAFVDFYIEKVVPNCRRFGFEIHCLDFLGIGPCHAGDHGHPPGRDSLYHQISGLVRLLEAINAVSPQMMTWSNSGNWTELLPKIAWSNPNLYLTDPFIATPWQGINMTRLLDDARREQMVSLHNTHFIPYRFLTNCQYFFSQNSIAPDIRHFEYGALSTLAVTPNLCLGEIRPWLDRLSCSDRDRVQKFYQHWTSFVRRHFDLWKTTCEAGEPPGMGAVEVYAHASGDRGFIFVVNPQYWSRTMEIPLDARLGFSGQGRCEIAELHPTPRLLLTSQGPFATLGSTVTVNAAAQQVLVLEVKPASDPVDSPRIYGLPGTIERAGSGYLIRTWGPQGRAERCAVLLPPGSPAITGAQVRADVPKLPKRQWTPTPIQYAPTSSGALLDITFRAQPAPSELRDWSVKPGDASTGIAGQWQKGFADGQLLRFPLFVDVTDARITLPMTDAQAIKVGLGPLASFCGGYIENAFSEFQETWIDLRTGATGVPSQTMPAVAEPSPTPPQLSAMATDERTGWWLQTRFDLPFMYTIGAEPFFDEHTILVLPLLRENQAKQVRAWINGQPLNVQRYRYPRNRALGCYYADLVGSGAGGGDNILVVHLQY